MKRLILGATLALLSACSGGTPLPPPGPLPAPTPRPGVAAFSADWTAPLGAALVCGGPGHADPFECALPPGAKWGVLLQDGNGGIGCVDPQPTVCFNLTSGQLGFHAVTPGMALISAQTLQNSGTISIRAVVTATNDCNTTNDVSFVGPVIYNGEGAQYDTDGGYRAFYLTCWDNGPITANLYSPTHAAAVSQVHYMPGSTHSLRIDWRLGVSAVYLVDDVPVFTEYPGFSADSLSLSRPPRPALWFGNVSGAVGQFDVYQAP